MDTLAQSGSAPDDRSRALFRGRTPEYLGRSADLAPVQIRQVSAQTPDKE
jgi:hypothetical protein